MDDQRTDSELMTAVAGGDEPAFATLVRRHQHAVYGTIVKMLGDPIEAEDLAQVAFVRVYRAAAGYRATAQFRTWLFTIVRNLVFNEHRRRGRAVLETLEGNTHDDSRPPREIPDAAAKSPAGALVEREMVEAVEKSILHLPEQQRMAVVLRRYDEFSYEEIAEVMGTTVPSVKSLLFRARETLKEALRKYLGE